MAFFKKALKATGADKAMATENELMKGLVADAGTVTLPAPCMREFARWLGWAEKLDEQGKKWSKRYIIIVNQTLFHYKKATDTKPSGWVDLNGYTPLSAAKEHKALCMKIEREGARTYYYQLETKANYDAIFAAATAETTKEEHAGGARTTGEILSGIQKKADFCGWMHKGDSNNKNWKRRFFALFNGILYYYKSDKEIEPSGYVVLVGYRVDPAPEISRTPHSFKLSHGGQGVRTWFMAGDVEEDVSLWKKVIQQATNMETIDVGEGSDEDADDDAGDEDNAATAGAIVNDGVAISNKEWTLDVPEEDVEKYLRYRSVLENPPSQNDWYKRFFVNQDHFNFIAKGADEAVYIVSMKEESVGRRNQYRVIIWAKEDIFHHVVHVDEDQTLTFADVLLQANAAIADLKLCFITVPASMVQETLLKLENDVHDRRMKIGVLYAKEGQTDEAAMFGNENGSKAFDAFLDLLGERVRLLDYEGYSAQLNTRCDKDGTHSVARKFNNYNIMFHVSTLMHFDQDDPQQVQRKRHIGNDIVVIVFVDGTTPYDMGTMLSQYTRVIPVVQHDKDDPDHYSLSVGTMVGIPAYGPRIMRKNKRDEAFIDCLLTKCINGQKATTEGNEFQTRARRTRVQYLDTLLGDLAKNDPKIYAKMPTTGKKMDKFRLSSSFTRLVDEEEDREVPKLFSVEGLNVKMPSRIISIDVYNQHMYFSTEEGLYSQKIGSSKPPDLVKNLQNTIQELQVSYGWNALIMRTDFCICSIKLFALDAMSDIHVSLIPNTKDAFAFAMTTFGTTELLVAGQSSGIVVINENIKTLQTISLDRPVDCICSLPHTKKVVIYGLYDAKTGSSQPIRLELNKGGTSSSKRKLFRKDGTGRLLDALDTGDGRAILAFERFCAVVQADGMSKIPHFVVSWGFPLHLSVVDDLIIAVGRNLVEVRSLFNGSITETHQVFGYHSYSTGRHTFDVPVYVCFSDPVMDTSSLHWFGSEYHLTSWTKLETPLASMPQDGADEAVEVDRTLPRGKLKYKTEGGEDQLLLLKGDIIFIHEHYDDGWSLCVTEKGDVGIVPTAFFDELPPESEAATAQEGKDKEDGTPEEKEKEGRKDKEEDCMDLLRLEEPSRDSGALSVDSPRSTGRDSVFSMYSPTCQACTKGLSDADYLSSVAEEISRRFPTFCDATLSSIEAMSKEVLGHGLDDKRTTMMIE